MKPISIESNELTWVKPNLLRKYKIPPADNSLIYFLEDLFFKFNKCKETYENCFQERYLYKFLMWLLLQSKIFAKKKKYSF